MKTLWSSADYCTERLKVMWNDWVIK